jgi:hypothetical protein
MLRALVSASVGPFILSRWQRLVPYRYSTCPLSCAGSVLVVSGGRFNFGAFEPLNWPPFPALYLAEDRKTAWAERYGRVHELAGLTSEELALTSPESVTCVSVSGTVERVIDLTVPNRLRTYAEVTATFSVSAELKRRARRLGFPVPDFALDDEAPPAATHTLLDASTYPIFL